MTTLDASFCKDLQDEIKQADEVKAEVAQTKVGPVQKLTQWIKQNPWLAVAGAAGIVVVARR